MEIQNQSRTDPAAVRVMIQQYIDKTGKKQSAVAKKIGISPATFSLFLNNRYSGNNEDVTESVLQFLKIETKRNSLSKKPDIFTGLKNTKEILSKVYIAQITGDILLIYGDAGCGKTTALKYYEKNNHNVIYIEADVTNNSYRSILTTIAEETGVNRYGSAAAIMKRLVRYFDGSAALLVIDEAQHLAPKAFDAIRALNDKAGIGIVYAGNPSIKKRMYGNHQDDYDQVYSRVGYHCPLYNRYSLKDIQMIFKDTPLDAECIKYLHKTAQRKGGMRVMIKQYCLAANLALSLEEPFNIVHLQEASERMGVLDQLYEK